MSTPRTYTINLGGGVLNPGFPLANSLDCASNPTGYTTIVRDISCSVDQFNPGDSLSVEYENLHTGAAVSLIFANNQGTDPLAAQVYHWEGRLRLNEGDQLQLLYLGVPLGQEASIVVTGYQFAGT